MQEPEQTTAPTTVTDTYKVSLEEALSVAENAFADMGASKTRSSMVESVEIIRGDRTRASDNLMPDTLLYLVNYSNDGGFALLGADKRLEPIYAISDEGRLETSFFEEHPGLALFKANMDEMIEEALAETRSSATIIGWPTTRYETYGPHLSVPQRSWHQSSPFNDFCPVSLASGRSHVVGCVPIAVATVMAYYEWPQMIQGRSIDWKGLNADPLLATTSRRRLLSYISRAENLNVLYEDVIDELGQWYSRANSFHANVKRTLENLDYIVNGDFQSSTYSALFEIVKKRPILTRGLHWIYNQDENGNDIMVQVKDKVGHLWVIDGAMRPMLYQNGIYVINKNALPYFHCSWGWTGGLANGYFLWKSGAFDAMPNKTDPTDNYTGNNVNEYNFRDLMFMTDFSPNK